MAIGSEGTNLLNDRYRRLLSKIFGKWGSFPTSLKVEIYHNVQSLYRAFLTRKLFTKLFTKV